MSSPKIAIVIYSMYGHIAKSAWFLFSLRWLDLVLIDVRSG
jgi:hypothetical protein